MEAEAEHVHLGSSDSIILVQELPGPLQMLSP